MTVLEKNKSIVLEAFDTLFNKRDYAAAERFWSPKYISLVPAYLSATLHAPDSIIGAGAFLATQISSVFAARVRQGHEDAPFPAYSSPRTPASACGP